MKALTIDQFKEVVEFAQKYHQFAKWPSDEEVAESAKLYPKIPKHGFNIKYIDSCYDSRTAEVWMVFFRSGRDGYRFATNHFNSINPEPKGWKYHTLYDLCMAYLKGEFMPKEEFYHDQGAK